MRRRQIEQPPFRIHKQRVERIILTGKMDHLNEAIEYIAKTGYVMSKVGPQMVKAQRATAKNENSFIVLGEKVVR